MHSVHDTLAGGLPHSEIYRSQLGYQLPVAFRRFQRLSSPLDAKSSTVCPYWFDHTDRTPTQGPTPNDLSMTSLTCRLGRPTLCITDPGIGRAWRAPFRRIRDFSVSIAELSLMHALKDTPEPPSEFGDLSSARRHPLVKEADSCRSSRLESVWPPLRGGGMIGRTNRSSNCLNNNSGSCFTILYVALLQHVIFLRPPPSGTLSCPFNPPQRAC